MKRRLINMYLAILAILAVILLSMVSHFLASFKVSASMPKKSFESLLQTLEFDPDPFHRAHAAVAIGAWRSDARSCIGELDMALKDDDATVRVESAYALAQIDIGRSNAPVSLLVQELGNADTLPRRKAIIYLGLLAPYSNKSVPKLLTLTAKTNNLYERVLAASSVLRVDRTQLDFMVPILIEGLSGDQAACATAAKELGELGIRGRPAITKLKDLVNSQDEYVRQTAIRALKQLSD